MQRGASNQRLPYKKNPLVLSVPVAKESIRPTTKAALSIKTSLIKTTNTYLSRKHLHYYPNQCTHKNTSPIPLLYKRKTPSLMHWSPGRLKLNFKWPTCKQHTPLHQLSQQVTTDTNQNVNVLISLINQSMDITNNILQQKLSFQLAVMRTSEVIKYLFNLTLKNGQY